MTPNGVITRPINYSVKETIDRIQAFLQSHGATVYARIDQQEELAKAGLSIPPMEFILFGNPKAGGKIIMENPLAALDLPLKILAWENDDHKVWLAYNDAAYIEERYALTVDPGSPLRLDNLITNALGSPTQPSPEGKA